MQCINKALISSSYENLIYNEKYCNDWFNNIDKIKNNPTKQLFGSFYSFSSTRYLFFAIVGSVNFHIGIAKYEIENNNYKIIELNEEDHKDIMNNIGDKLVNNNLIPRKWGKKWVTVDCGKFIEFDNANVFALMYNLNNSEIFNSKFKPLLEVLVNKNK
jgi:hypothetical protein